jgi:hypothetical protein
MPSAIEIFTGVSERAEKRSITTSFLVTVNQETKDRLAVWKLPTQLTGAIGTAAKIIVHISL